MPRLRDSPQTISLSDSKAFFDEISLGFEATICQRLIGAQGPSEITRKGPEDDRLRICGKSLNSLTIFFPFLNDAQTVDLLIAQAYLYGHQVAKNLEVIAIHGGASKDQTWAEMVKAKGKYPDLILLDHSSNRDGYGVIRHGFQAATKEWVFYTDGDGQYHLSDLPKLAEKANQSDIVNGYKIHRSDSWIRIWLGKGYQLFSGLLFQLPIRDIDCDFRLIRRKYLQSIHFKSRGASILPELILNLKQLGARFSEVPVQHFPRLYGRSNYTPIQLFFEKLIGDFKLFCDWKKGRIQESTIFQTMRQVEEKLWWYVALRESIFSQIEKIPIKPSICDVGCGTGCTMEYLQKKGCSIHGIDPSSVALNYCLERGLENIQQGSALALPIQSSSFDLVLLIDVLCMLESSEVPRAILEIKRILKPGGKLIINEPAFRWMKSQHDQIYQIKRRRKRGECIALLTEQGFKIEQASYRVCFLFPIIVAIRFFRKIPFLPKAYLKTPSPPINFLLLAIQRWENRLIQKGCRLPFGLSVFLVATR